jgi:hypothetical protein
MQGSQQQMEWVSSYGGSYGAGGGGYGTGYQPSSSAYSQGYGGSSQPFGSISSGPNFDDEEPLLQGGTAGCEHEVSALVDLLTCASQQKLPASCFPCRAGYRPGRHPAENTGHLVTPAEQQNSGRPRHGGSPVVCVPPRRAASLGEGALLQPLPMAGCSRWRRAAVNDLQRHRFEDASRHSTSTGSAAANRPTDL